MQWKQIESSAISKVAWQDHILYVQFCNERIYCYSNVSFNVYQQLLACDSIGRFVNYKIKPYYEVNELQVA